MAKKNLTSSRRSIMCDEDFEDEDFEDEEEDFDDEDEDDE